MIGNTIIVPNQFWELPDGTSPCKIVALIESEVEHAYDYAVAFDEAEHIHYRMSSKQVKHLATKNMKKKIKGAAPQPIAQ